MTLIGPGIKDLRVRIGTIASIVISVKMTSNLNVSKMN